MTDYNKSTNFTSKDSLSTGNPLKIVKGAEFDTEFNNIATAIATKYDTSTATTALALKANLASPTFTGTPEAPTASVNTNTTQLATTAFVVAQIADDAPTKTGTGASGTWEIDITGNAATADLADSASATGTDSVTTASIVDRSVTGVKIAKLSSFPTLTVSAADTYTLDLGLTKASTATTTSSTSYTTMYTVTVNKYSGSIRFKATQLPASDGAGSYANSYLRISKNGVEVISWTISGNSTVARSSDVTVAAGDVITYEMKTNNAGYTAGISTISQTASDGYAYIYPVGKFTENS